jgi:hypothetical protein
MSESLARRKELRNPGACWKLSDLDVTAIVNFAVTLEAEVDKSFGCKV